MKRYDSYKDSGIEWLGEIPNHWEVKRLSWCFGLIGSGTTPKADNDEYYSDGKLNWLLTGDLNDGEVWETSKKITQKALDDYSILKEYPENSLVIAMYGATIGKLGLLKLQTTVNQACCVLAKPTHLNNTFAFYSLLAARIEIINMSYGGGQPNISQELIKSFRTPIPTLAEQTAIASFLDRKTTEIDQLIANKKRLIELYEEEKTAIINQAVTKGIDPDVKLKDSGIEWLGEIPEHWEVKRLKHIVSKVGSGITPSGGAAVYQQSGIPLLRSQNIHFEGIKLDDVAYISEEIHEGMNNSKVISGDVLLNITGASIGRVYFVNETLGDANVNQHVCIIRPRKNILSKYLYLIFRSNIGQEQIRREQTGSGREGLNFESIKNFFIPLVDLTEQNAIINYIDEKCSYFDTQISKTKKLIDLLTEYRTTLISEVVTGKIKVV